MARPVTLHDVARRAGVGKSTVSNVLSRSGRVSEATRERVRAAMAELGYVPNRAARQLRGGRTGIIGVYVPGVPSTSEFYMRFVFGIMERAAARDRDVTILTASEHRSPRALDGVVVADPHRDDEFVPVLMRGGMPVVCFERPPDGMRPEVVLWADHHRAVTGLLDRMAVVGARRPALVAPPETGDWAAQLAAGYRDWCARHGVPTVVAQHPWVPSPSEVFRAVEQVLAQPGVDALVCASVDTAPTAVQVLHRLGRQVGRDVLLASATESSALRLGQPPITALDLSPLDAGRRCADLLDDLIGGGPGGIYEHPVHLWWRDSTRGSQPVTASSVPVPPPSGHRLPPG
ncbi:MULTISPECIES: LacI family DNA-binding transcriptional regulator [Micromonospora]|uniref:Transcriptional regulator, LacI family n=1 Tax=Micromonospora yangpuensis TaxID=683228 RepID=A0A1C6V3W7_9ACTN|nr:LacI family DNA-binding transcriptional regulator [Micromonospora yangpuensis]GGM15205.1 putative LacI-family transcriptional regulator [Micromonospora yangpuensis]SCL60928.1 transcriptional regulator, LacI family [Micromonospora yangpuensis]